MIRNLLFDWSGTLADDLGPVLAATNAIFHHYGRSPISREDFRRHFRLPFADFYSEFLPEATAEGLQPLYERYFHALQDGVTLLPGAREVLDYCRAKDIRTFLLSTIHEQHFATQASQLGVLDAFEHPYIGIMDKREKIRDILHTHALNPAETAFVGDMVHDIETARHGGVLDIAILTGYDPADKLIAAQPSVIVENLAALQRLL